MTDVSLNPAGDPRELDLTPDRLPGSLWLAAGIPVFTALLVFWLHGHWQGLSYRGYSDDPDWLWRRNAYQSMVRGILSFLVFDMWLVAYGLGHWFGWQRTAGREARFNVSIANAWAMALFIPAIQLGTTLDLSWQGMAICLVMVLVGFGALAITARRARSQDPSPAPSQSSPWWYFDWHDPALASSRGLNLGNPWQWVLFAAGLLLPAAATYLLFRFQLP
jgi:signal transduction histidine kinase